MALPTGVYEINANSFQSDLTIAAVNADGTLQATMFGGQRVIGFWDEAAQKVTFILVGADPVDPSRLQIYTGYLLENSPIPTLAGSFEAFAGTGGSAQRSVFGWFAQSQSGPPDRPHARCGWINDRDPIGNPAGVVSFQNNAGFFHAIHPFFYFIHDSTFALTATTQDPNNVIPSAAQAAGTALWPAIAGPSDIDGFGQLLNDPGRCDRHVQALVSELRAPQLVPGNPVYAGFEIDYEGLDNRYQEGFLQFLRDLTDEAHGLGKQISITVGAWTTEQASAAFYPGSPYNYTKLLDIVDLIHPQFYDFHRIIADGSGHIGPVAPRGWVSDALEVVVNPLNTGRTQKFIYGMPNYGLTAKVISGNADPTVTHAPNGLHWDFDSLNQLRGKCDPSTFQTTTDHMQRPCPPPLPDLPPCCPYENTDQNFSAGRQPNCHQAADPSTTQFFDDLDSLEERLRLAHDQGLGGMVYYTVGDELPGFFDMVKKYF